ncbi:MAG TPA: S9 family peptidase [Miltoncostaeaceae bacterium]|nr:S9 family peptidase [Miltoncostaeaceae bacterium]
MPPPPLIPLRHLFDNPERAGARLSPDGRTISYLAPRDGVLNVWVEDRDGGAARPVTDDRDRGIRSYFWSRDGRYLLYLQDRGGNEDTHVYAVDPSRPDVVRDLTPFDGVRAGIVAAPRATPRHVLVSMNLRDRSVFDVYRVALSTGRRALVARNPGDVIAWTADRQGRLRAAYAQTPAGDYAVLVRDDEAGEFRVVAEYGNEDRGIVFGFTQAGDRLWVGSARGSDLLRLVLLDPATGAEEEVDADDEADLSGPVVSDRTGTLLAAFYLRDRVVVHPHDAGFARDWEAVRRLHGGDPVISGQDAEETTWIVGFDDDRDPGATYLFDRRTHEARFLYRPRPWLSPDHLAPMEPVRITSRDGLTLRAYLTLPVGVPHEGLPAVLLVHGGPWSRDSWGFDPQAQFLANRGYAVLQVNYRGSTGFGKAFAHAAEREFAGRMHDDLIDGADWLVDRGYADPARLGIYGGSYGGYAALVGVTFTPDVFAAAVSYVGPSSLVTLVRSFPAYWRPLLASTWYRYVGDPDDPDDLADMERRSPLNLVDRIRTPLLVIQGANDPRVTQRESDQIVAALRARGVDVEYIVKDDEGHGFVKPENRMEAYGAIERFFARHLGGRTDAGG